MIDRLTTHQRIIARAALTDDEGIRHIHQVTVWDHVRYAANEADDLALYDRAERIVRMHLRRALGDDLATIIERHALQSGERHRIVLRTMLNDT